MHTYFTDVQASLFAFCKSCIDEWKSEGITSEMLVFKWDAHAETPEFPDVDIVGPMDLSLISDTSLQSATCMIAVSTTKDTNIHRLDQIISDLYGKLSPDKSIPLVRASDGAQYGNLKLKNGTQVLQVMNTDVRATRAVAINLGADSVPAN